MTCRTRLWVPAALALAAGPALAQTTAITGATLIDGTGRAPVQDAVIILQGNRISYAGSSRGVAIPRSATRVLASTEGSDRADRCDLVEMTVRLRLAHPLGAAKAVGPQCLGDEATWVPTAPMDAAHRAAWRRALAALRDSNDADCRLAASTLVWLEQVGAVSVWVPADTAAGLVFFGASYATASTSPLAVQFWAPAFDRPVDWLAGAMAHEAFHILHTGASEAEALAFGQACARSLLRPVPSGD